MIDQNSPEALSWNYVPFNIPKDYMKPGITTKQYKDRLEQQLQNKPYILESVSGKTVEELAKQLKDKPLIVVLDQTEEGELLVNEAYRLLKQRHDSVVTDYDIPFSYQLDPKPDPEDKPRPTVMWPKGIWSIPTTLPEIRAKQLGGLQRVDWLAGVKKRESQTCTWRQIALPMLTRK